MSDRVLIQLVAPTGTTENGVPLTWSTVYSITTDQLAEVRDQLRGDVIETICEPLGGLS